MTDEELLTTPSCFLEETFGLPTLYDWQSSAIEPLYRAGFTPEGVQKPIVQISVLAPNEAGKSRCVVAGAALYFANIKQDGKVAITTKDQKQLNEQIIPAIEPEIPKMAGWKSVRSPYYKVTDEKGNTRIMAYVTDDAGRVEGVHGSPQAPLLIIVDEAKSVDEKIFQAIDRCGYQAILYCSSGGLMQGTFYDSQTKNRDKWHIVNAGLKDCPHISQDKVKRIIEKWGENHPFTRSCIYGEFMEQDDDVQFIFLHSAVKRALENPPRHREGVRVGFVDFAEGNAEHALAVRNGNKTRIELAFREADKHSACSRLIRAFINAGLSAEQLWGDAADKESLDILASLGWAINRKNFGSEANNKEMYTSWSAEAWIETSIALSKGELILPDDDDVLIAQLTSRQKVWSGRGKMAAEDKHDMRKRGVESPDRGDAYCGANNVYAQVNNTRAFGLLNAVEEAEQSEYEETASRHGAFAGV